MFKKYILLFVLFFSVLLPINVFAQNTTATTETFEAEVLTIKNEKEFIRDDGSVSTQQDISLKGLTGSWKDKKVDYNGIGNLDVVSQNTYKVGDRVVINWNQSFDGGDQFYIMDFVRRGYLYLLTALFVVLIIAVGRTKGLRSILSLIISFIIIIKFIIPAIISGSSPLIVALIGSMAILGSIIYITDGFNKRTHVSLLSVIISLSLTFALSWFFVYITRLTGFSSEDTSFLVGIGTGIVDFKGLLLAGILIGTVGVLDDAILGQVEVVEQIRAVNSSLSEKEVLKTANKIGRTHLGAIVNTLFLTYAGASLPLLILFTVNQDIGLGFAQVINNEVIATEIIRTLAGSMGLALAFPVTTWLAVHFLAPKNI